MTALSPSFISSTLTHVMVSTVRYSIPYISGRRNPRQNQTKSSHSKSHYNHIPLLKIPIQAIFTNLHRHSHNLYWFKISSVNFFKRVVIPVSY